MSEASEASGKYWLGFLKLINPDAICCFTHPFTHSFKQLFIHSTVIRGISSGSGFVLK